MSKARKERGPAERLATILRRFSRYTGHAVTVDEAVYRSERDTGHRNRAISHLLRNAGILEGPPEEVLDTYFQQCAINVTARDLAMIGACLANNGVNPITGVAALEERYVDKVLSVMGTCGMYDYSGAWMYEIGMPAKSGVAGGIEALGNQLLNRRSGHERVTRVARDDLRVDVTRRAVHRQAQRTVLAHARTAALGTTDT